MSLPRTALRSGISQLREVDAVRSRVPHAADGYLRGLTAAGTIRHVDFVTTILRDELAVTVAYELVTVTRRGIARGTGRAELMAAGAVCMSLPGTAVRSISQLREVDAVRPRVPHAADGYLRGLTAAGTIRHVDFITTPC